MGKHDVGLEEAEWRYTFRPGNGEVARGFVEGLEEWFGRLWRAPERSVRFQLGEKEVEDEHDSNAAPVGTWAGEEAVEHGRQPPMISVKSVRRNGRRMADFKEGLWQIQEAMGDMHLWKTWTPPPDRKTE